MNGWKILTYPLKSHYYETIRSAEMPFKNITYKWDSLEVWLILNNILLLMGEKNTTTLQLIMSHGLSSEHLKKQVW